MLSKKIYSLLFLKILALCLTSMIFSYFLLQNQLELSILAVMVLLGILVHLMYYLSKTYKKIDYFFSAIKNNDTTLYFSEDTSKTPTKQLNQHLNQINGIIKSIKTKIKTQDQYYKTILEQAQIGVLTINQEGHILFANKAIKKLFSYEHLTHLSQLKKINPNLFDIINSKTTFNNQIIELTNEREVKSVIINGRQIILDNKPVLTVIASNIKNELDDKEIDSWIKLIKVLSHEIMNTLTPINSITETLYDNLLNNKSNTKQTIEGLKIINEQTQIIQDFVKSYRQFSGFPVPQKKNVLVSDLFYKIQQLFQSNFEEKNIRFISIISQKDISIYVDEQQIYQVLINLVKNAVESMEQTSSNVLKLICKNTSNSQTCIQVIDTGIGIPEELEKQIFVPFFSTKQEGSGVGLSLSKHIMKMHNGSLSAHSIPDKETCFTLYFPQYPNTI